METQTKIRVGSFVHIWLQWYYKVEGHVMSQHGKPASATTAKKKKKENPKTFATRLTNECGTLPRLSRSYTVHGDIFVIKANQVKTSIILAGNAFSLLLFHVFFLPFPFTLPRADTARVSRKTTPYSQT